ncbi:coiled-coil domain-containing protein 17 isoform X2 [Eleutherodactylus coqui]|uniref:coiled-coil domain-containing protein 17 isoform X2 n=1 Tax=Eleutherodactylus coqui TaxID=57060 RepID=UPI0034627E24
MADLGAHRCRSCNMVFRSASLLEKHREKFCIGSQIGDPTILGPQYIATGVRTWPSDGREFPRRTETPDFKTRDSIARLRARENLLNEREQRLIGEYGGQPGSLTDSKALRNLTEEFHKLRKSLEGSVPTLRSFQGESGLCSYWDKEYRERILEMTEAHERHLADIQTRNQALEMQREESIQAGTAAKDQAFFSIAEIRQRLSDVASSGSASSHIEQMLLELKAQEEKNQLALDALRDQVVLIQSESRAKTEKENKERPSSSSAKKKGPLAFIPLPVCGSSLSSEISALQLAYVQSGGTDPAVLAQMRDLQAEALAFEEMSHKQERKERKKKRHDGAPRMLDVELMAVELENQRLEEEIFNLRLQRSRKKVENEDSELALLQREHLQQMSQLQADIEMLKRDVTRKPCPGGQGPPPFQPPLPPHVHPSGQTLGRPEPTLAFGGLDSLRPSSHAAHRHLEPLDALGPAPYDPVSGFVIFYDFILGLEPTFQKVRLVSGLYSNGHRMGQPSSLPDALCEVWNSSQHQGNVAMLRAKQPIPRVRPSSSISLVMELQAAGGFNPYGQEIQHMASSGWTKVDVFDQHNQVLSGRWKLPVRALPVQPGLSTGQLNTVPQVGKAEIYLRVVNARDADLQSMAEIDPRKSSPYLYPPLMPGPTAVATDPPVALPAQPPSSFHLALSPYTDYIDPPPIPELPNQPKPGQRDNDREEKTSKEQPRVENKVGFIIDRVTEAPPGDGTLRLTGYHMNTGQVIRTRGEGMSCIVSAVSSTVQSGCFIFGEQEAIFHKVAPEDDLLLLLRFYHWPGGSTAWAPWHYQKSLQPLLASEEWAVAWTAVRLTRPLLGTGAASCHPGSRHVEWNTGIHDLPLYHRPAPAPLQLAAVRPGSYEEMFEPYGGAKLRICIFSTTRPDLPFPEVSPVTDSDGNSSVLPEGVYVPRSRRAPAADSYQSDDIIRLFIDGARFLPDAVTVTRVTGRIFDRNYDQIGPDICTTIDLNSDIFQPSYNYSVEIKSPNVPPTATLLLKVSTIDRFARDLTLIGWAAINLFVESGTARVPKSDSGDVQIAVNEGAHQIRLYHRRPPTDQPCSVESLTSSGCIVPCATLLLCITKAGAPETSRGRPEYSQGVYFSSTAQPTPGETQLYRAMVNRSMVRVREVIPLLAGGSLRGLVADELLSDWVTKTFNEKMKEAPRPFRLCCVSPYLAMSGLKVSVDSANNLPWSGFTVAHICFNPPAAFYYGDPWMRYDRAAPIHDIDMDSHQHCPVWRDGFKTFTRRVFHKHLTLIIHLHEIVTQEPEGNVLDSEQAPSGSSSPGTAQLFKPGSQAWTALGVFYKSYCNLGVYQLPLYEGAPSQAALRVLRSGDCQEKLQQLEEKTTIVRLAACSVIVRIADGRRQEEVTTYSLQDINLTYLPEDAKDAARPSGRRLAELVPRTLRPDAFKTLLVNWYTKYLTSQPPGADVHPAVAGSEPLIHERRPS